MSDNHISWEQAVQWLRNQPDQQELVRACYYDDPLLEAARRYEASREWQAVRQILPGGKGNALDLGAGRGVSSYALASAGWDVTALEPDPSNLVGAGAIRSLAKAAGLPIKVVESLAEDMNLGAEQYDLVYAREVLHHAADLSLMCRQAANALKRGGIFLACREHVITRPPDLQIFLDNHPLHRLYGGENAFPLRTYISAIQASGLKLKSVMGPYETVINYFPLSQEEWRTVVSAPLRKRVGAPLTDFLIKPDHIWSASVTRALASLRSRMSQVPGRLYTFLAYKP